MALTKHKLGELIEQVDERNTDRRYGLESVRGISIEKKFIHTKADMSGVSLEGYKLVGCHQFAYVPITSRNSDKITLAHNLTNETYLISSTYIAFEVKRPDLVCDEYLFLFFNRSEFDRLARFNSWGSARESLSWVDLCDVDIELPPLDVQRKYVKIYQAMKENVQVYEDKLEELQDAYELQLDGVKQLPRRPLGELIGEVDVRNRDLTVTSASGVNKQKVFMPSKAAAADLSNYKLVMGDQLACNLMHIGRDEAIPVSMNRVSRPVLVSPAYLVMSVNADVDPGYLFAWLCRSEVDRQAWFVADTSIRSGLEKARFYELEIPLPSKEAQRGIAELQAVYEQRRSICERLQDMIKDVCSVLVRGALLEGERMEVS